MGQKRLPWFKVQNRLTSNPKFRALDDRLKGHLLSIWCCAADQPERGILPSIKEIAYHLGDSFSWNRNRVIPRVLEPLKNAGFLDYDHARNMWKVHDWEHWQSSPNLTADLDKMVTNTTADTTNHTTAGQPVVVSGIENKELTAEYIPPRSIEGKNRVITNVITPLGQVQSMHKTAKNNGHDERYLPLKDFMEEKYREYRGMSLGSATKTSDWVQVAAMLKRSRSDMQFSISNLQQSFLQWLTGSPKWEREQSIGWWASNAHRFIGNKTLQSIKPQRVYRPTLDDSADLEWWKKE